MKDPQVVQLYSKGFSLNDVARKLNSTVTMIKKVLVAQGVPIRQTSEAIQASRKANRKITKESFSFLLNKYQMPNSIQIEQRMNDRWALIFRTRYPKLFYSSYLHYIKTNKVTIDKKPLKEISW